MSARYEHLFTPIELRHKTVKNRITFGAHTANMSLNGIPGDQHLEYYTERARGGAGMIVVEPVPVHRTAVLTRGNFRHGDDSLVPHFRRITDACHEFDVVMIQQLYHIGAHGDWDNSFEPNWSPSGFASLVDADGSHAMSESEIDEVIEGFVDSARRASEAGFDGVELMAAYNALIEQFWSPLTNSRTDRWGGVFENRMRFSSEILTRIRLTVGDDFIIGMCVTGDDKMQGGLQIEDMQEIASYHDTRGLVDYFTVGTGSYYEIGLIVPMFLYDEMQGPQYAAKIKQVVNSARVQAESRIRTVENAELVIAEGHADLVSLVRAQIADPHLARKASSGKAEDIRPCISCNQLCIGRRFRDYWISCLVNPSVGREHEWGGDLFAAASERKNLVVVGAGPAGLEAARVAAERGHSVTIFERSEEIGGQFRLAAKQPQRDQIAELLVWYGSQLQKLCVEVRLQSETDAETLMECGADAVIIATGSVPARTGFQRALPHVSRLSGADRENVFAVEDVLSGNGQIGRKVLLVDDGGLWKGPGTALFLAERGHQVAIVTGEANVGMSLGVTLADASLRKRLTALGVTSIGHTAVIDWSGATARLQNLLDGAESERPYDSLVLATLNRPETALLETLADTDLAIHAIGDCVAPRRASVAFYEGRKLALAL